MRQRADQGTTRREWLAIFLFLLAVSVTARAASIEFVGSMGGGGGSTFSGDMDSTTNKVLSNSGATASGSVASRDDDGLAVENAAGTNRVVLTAAATNRLNVDGQLDVTSPNTVTARTYSGPLSAGSMFLGETNGIVFANDQLGAQSSWSMSGSGLTLDTPGLFTLNSGDTFSVNAITGNGAGIELRETTGVIIADDAGANSSLFTASASVLTLNVNGTGALTLTAGDKIITDRVDLNTITSRGGSTINIDETSGISLRLDAGTNGSTITPSSGALNVNVDGSGTFTLAAGDTLTVDAITTTSANTTLVLSGAGTGGVSVGTEPFTFSNLAAGSDANGDIAVRIAGTYARRAIGAANTFLASNGSTPDYRLLAGTDIDELLASSDLTDFSAAKSGTGASAVSNVAPTIQDLTLSTFVSITDQAGSPGTAGRLQRNGANVEFHDGTAARVLEKQSNKGAANGYASLDGSTKVPSAQISEVLASTDLSDVAAKTGTGTTIVFGTGPTLSELSLSTYAAFTDQAGNAGAAGRLQRNGSELSWHNGTAATNLEQLARKGAASGYCDLDASTLVPNTRLDGELSSIASLTSAADRGIYYTGSQTAALFTLTSFARTLTDDSDAATARGTLAAAGVVAVQTFTASGTYTPRTGILYAIIECVGGGGGGGACDGAVGSGLCAAGGGAGQYSMKIVSASDIGANKTVTIGAAGAAGATASGSGGNGGTTSVGTLCTAGGGTGGTGMNSGSAPAQGGPGGSGGTSDIATVGMAGGPGVNITSATATFATGQGGSSPWGSGGLGGLSGFTNTAAGSAGTGFGAGGGGGTANNTTSDAAGGAGTAGAVRITEFATQ